ncbi:MAG: right-handed parallel beta-helix repeat-containing protein [Thermoproteota archaeon]|nr:right-handed parallel beta-helix repeat-containing protein [Thermoproteota archaeon]
MSTQQVRFSNASPACVNYQGGVNTITIACDASFLDVLQAIHDPRIVEQEAEQRGQYILSANLEVADGVNFQMTSNGDGLQYLKLAGENGIIVYGKILIDGVKITSWDIAGEDVIPQDVNGTIRRAYVQFAGSEGAQILNSEFGYLGYDEPGRRGFDLYGSGGPSHDMQIRNSTFHDMWFAFYSNAAYNIVVDRSEYHHNLRYGLDPHTGTHDMNITNNYLHHNRYGAICSEDCYNILIEGNTAHNNTDAGIVFSRNMTNSIARNNHVYNATTGISVSESPNNQIYNNTIESATDVGILLFNPEVIDDGSTEGNVVYDNVMSSSKDGVRATNSHDNILENNTFDDIESSEYLLSLNSNVLIRGQIFDDALIAVSGSTTENHVEVVDSGVIEVTERPNEQEEENETSSHNTDIQSYTKRMSDGDSIMINSQNL